LKLTLEEVEALKKQVDLMEWTAKSHSM